VARIFKTQTGNLNLIKVNNSFGNFFIDGAAKAEICFTEENISMNDWFSNLKIKSKLNELLKYKTTFHLDNVQVANIYGRQVKQNRKITLLEENKLKFNQRYVGMFHEKRLLGVKRYLTSEEKELLNINIKISFDQAFKTKKTVIRNLFLNTIELRGRSEGSIAIENCKINEIYIKNFSPKLEFLLYNIQSFTKRGKFEIQDSNLDNTWFNSVKLKDYFIVFNRS
jgi:hypothetical protein